MNPTVSAVTFRVYGIAQPKGSARAFLPTGHTRPIVTSTNRNASKWEQAIRSAIGALPAAPFYTDGVTVALRFALPRPKSLPKRVRVHTKRPDGDKLARCAIDAMNGVLFRDDAQVVELVVRKEYVEGGSAPYAEITVGEAVSLCP